MNEKAISTLNELLDLAKRLHGEDNVNVSGTYNLMGYNYMMMSDVKNAIANLNKCISIDIKVYGEKSLEVIRDYNILASMYRMTGETDKAIATYVIVENLAALTEDEDAKNALTEAYTNIAALYMESKNFEAAHEYMGKKIHLCMHLYGRVSREVLEAYNQMLSIVSHMEDSDEEIAEILQEIDDIREKAGISDEECGKK